MAYSNQEDNSLSKKLEIIRPFNAPEYPTTFPEDMRYYHGYARELDYTSYNHRRDGDDTRLKYTYTLPDGSIRAAEMDRYYYDELTTDPKTHESITDPAKIKEILTQKTIEAYTLVTPNESSPRIFELKYEIPYYNLDEYIKQDIFNLPIKIPIIKKDGVTKVDPAFAQTAKDVYNYMIHIRNHPDYGPHIVRRPPREPFSLEGYRTMLSRAGMAPIYYGSYSNSDLDEQARAVEYKIDAQRELNNTKIPSLTGDVVMAYFDGVTALSERARGEFQKKHNIYVPDEDDNISELSKQEYYKTANLELKRSILLNLASCAGIGYQQQIQGLQEIPLWNLGDYEDRMDQIYENLVTNEFNFKKHSATGLTGSYVSPKNANSDEMVDYPYQLDESLYKKYISEDIESAKSPKELLEIQDAFERDSKSLYINDVDADIRVENLKKKIVNNRLVRDEKQWNSFTPEQKAEVINTFKSEVLPNIPLYEQFLGTDKISYTDKEYEALYREFQKDVITNGANAAFANLQPKLQNHIEGNMDGLEKFGRLCINWFDVAVTDLAYIPAMAGGYFYNGIAEGKWGINSLVNNPATHYLNDVVASGAWDPSKQQEYINKGIHENGVVWSTEQENDFWSARLAGDLFTQSAHLVGIWGGSSGVGWLAKKTARGCQKIAALTKSYQAASAGFNWSDDVARAAAEAMSKQSAQKVGAIAGLVSSVAEEGGMEASNVYQEKTRAANFKQLEMEDNAYHQYVDEQLLRDPAKFEAMYPSNAAPLVSPEKDYFAYIDQLRTFMYNNPQARQNYLKSNEALQSQIAFHQKNAIESAETASMVTFALNAVMGTVTNLAQKSLWTPEMRSYLGNKNLKTKLTPGKGWTASFSGTGTGKILLDGAWELGSQFAEEYGQNIYANIGKSVGDYLYNEKAIGTTATELSEVLAAAFQGASQAALSKEALEEGLIGMMSAGIGIPSLRRPSNTSPKGEGESNWSYFKRRNYVSWNSPIVETIDKLKENKSGEDFSKEQDILDAVNSWIGEGSHQQALFDAVRKIEIMHEFGAAMESGDPRAIASAQVKMVYETAATVAVLEGSDYYKAQLKELHDQMNVKVENLDDPNSYESRLVVSLLNIPGNQDLTPEQALKTISDTAAQVNDMIVDMAEIKKEVEKAFEGQDPVVMSLVIRSAAMSKEYARRRQQDCQEIGQYQQQLPTTPRTKLSKDALIFILQYESIAGAEEALSAEKVKYERKIEEVQKEIEETTDKAQRKALERTVERYKQSITEFEEYVAKNRAEIEALPEHERIPSVDDILELLKLK